MVSLSNRVISIYNRKTSMRLAPAEWDAIETICKTEKMTRKKLFEIIDINRNKNLGFTTSVRLFSIIYYRCSLINGQNAASSNTENSPIFQAVNGII